MDVEVVGSGYADHLTDADLELLASVSPGRGEPARGAEVAWLRRHPEHLPALLGDPHVFQALFGPGPAAVAALASPFLIFAVAVHRAAAELESMDHVPERSGPRQRVPLFDAPDLRDFLGSPARRLFLAELLASFTRAAGGQDPAVVRGRPPTRRFRPARGRGRGGGPVPAGPAGAQPHHGPLPVSRGESLVRPARSLTRCSRSPRPGRHNGRAAGPRDWCWPAGRPRGYGMGVST